MPTKINHLWKNVKGAHELYSHLCHLLNDLSSHTFPLSMPQFIRLLNEYNTFLLQHVVKIVCNTQSFSWKFWYNIKLFINKWIYFTICEKNNYLDRFNFPLGLTHFYSLWRNTTKRDFHGYSKFRFSPRHVHVRLHFSKK